MLVLFGSVIAKALPEIKIKVFYIRNTNFGKMFLKTSRLPACLTCRCYCNLFFSLETFNFYKLLNSARRFHFFHSTKNNV